MFRRLISKLTKLHQIILLCALISGSLSEFEGVEEHLVTIFQWVRSLISKV